MTDSKSYYRVLTIAGSDSGGGAGIQADLKTIAANGCYGMSVITALTAQNTLGVSGIHAVPVDFVRAQMDAVLSGYRLRRGEDRHALFAELIRAVAEGLQRHGVQRIVLDPVMVAQSGDKLLQDEAIDALRKYLIPLADIITPNLPEASVLLGRDIADAGRNRRRRRSTWQTLDAGSVLIKGGHLEPATATIASISRRKSGRSSCREDASPPATTTVPAAPSLRRLPPIWPRGRRSRSRCKWRKTISSGNHCRRRLHTRQRPWAGAPFPCLLVNRP